MDFLEKPFLCLPLSLDLLVLYSLTSLRGRRVPPMCGLFLTLIFFVRLFTTPSIWSFALEWWSTPFSFAFLSRLSSKHRSTKKFFADEELWVQRTARREIRKLRSIFCSGLPSFVLVYCFYFWWRRPQPLVLLLWLQRILAVCTVYDLQGFWYLQRSVDSQPFRAWVEL